MLGSVKDLDADDALFFADIQHDVIGKLPIDDRLSPVVQADIE